MRNSRPLPESLESLLPAVSRSFYLTLRILPQPIRPQIALAYLLARAGDTIADTTLVGAGRRGAALRALCGAIEAAADGKAPPPIDFGDLARAQPSLPGRGSPAEKILLESISAALAILRNLEGEDRERIGGVLATIFSGQLRDLSRFSPAAGNGIVALEDDAELDDYTYRVAGCVGEFWTRICRARLFPRARLDDAGLLADGIRFGKGLQLINILRDLPADLRQHRCYVPRLRLAAHGLEPQALLDPSSMERFRPLFNDYIDVAVAHLEQGWNYTLSLPFEQVRVRLACSWPLLIGVRTLVALRTANVLDAGHTVRISHRELRKVMVQSILRYPFPPAWRRLFRNAGRSTT